MIKIYFSFLCIAFSAGLYAQDDKTIANAAAIPEANCTSVDELAAYIKQHFVSDTSRLRAIYVWVANNIRYDTERYQEVLKKVQKPPQTVPEVLKARSAVCQGYSDLFTALCRNVGINATTVSGYVKLGGKVMPVGHAWVATELNGEWFLFDPTWSAGYVDNNLHFVKLFNNAFYKVQPATFIADHMPFDPMNQFLINTLNNREFIEGKAPAAKTTFNYKDSLIQYNKLSQFDQMDAHLRRLEGAGVENDLLQEQKKYLTINRQSQISNNSVQEAGIQFNAAITLLNKYYGFKNKQFAAIGDNDLLQALDSMKHYIILARSLMSATVTQSEEQQAAKKNNLAGMDQYWTALTVEERFVQQYIITDKARRFELFMKRK